MPDPVKTSYGRSLYDTVTAGMPRGIGTLIEGDERLTSKYDIGLRPYQNPNYRRAELQSGWEQLGNASIQSLAEIAGGTIESLGY
jgi:hypothetical protein